MIDLVEIFPTKSSELEISLSVKSYDKKSFENCSHFYDAVKRIVSKLSKISKAIPNYDISDANEVPISIQRDQ